MLPGRHCRVFACALTLSALLALWSCATPIPDGATPGLPYQPSTAAPPETEPGADGGLEPDAPITATDPAQSDAPHEIQPADRPVPLTPDDQSTLLARAAALIRATDETVLPVTRGTDSFLGAAADINANGRNYGALLLVGAEFRDLAAAETLADASRLFRADARTPNLYLAVFADVDTQPTEMHRFSLGRRRVVTAVTVEPLASDHRGQAGPTLFSVSVTTRGGTEQYWCGFGANGTPSMVVIENDGATRTVVRDIDGNGLRDVIRSQQIQEPGRVVETLITWTRWTERGFQTEETINVVRNLTRFLDTARRHAVSGNLVAFADHAVLPSTRTNLADAGWSLAGTVDALFAEEPSESGVTADESARSPGHLIQARMVGDLVFPVVTRSPFSEVGSESSVRTGVRLITTTSDDLFFHVDLTMGRNPFDGRQFYLRPIELPRRE